MAWAIGSKNSKNAPTQALRWRLLLSYLSVMVAILSVSTAAVYEFTRRSLYDQMDQRLEILAQAASHSLLAIKAESTKHSKEPGISGAYSRTIRRLDHDGDLDIPWQRLREADQGVEWFDARQQLVGNAGTLLHTVSPQPGFSTLQNGRIRAVTLTVYRSRKTSENPEGFIRTSEDTQDVEAVLSRLRWGLGVGGILLLGITGLGGIWLTRQSLRPIEQSLHQLKQFTADAAHELRSPLATLKTTVQVMQCYPERIHPQDTKKLNAIAATTDHMIHLVEDLLLLARMEAAAITKTQDWSPLALDRMLNELVIQLRPQAQAKGILMQAMLADECIVLGDSAQLNCLFRNLLDNALQYTPTSGAVALSIRRVESSVWVAVEDTGFGIAPEDLKLVFDRFWRADKARSQRKGGMGMGLAIAQAIAHCHGGNITVSSKLGEGTCFQVRLPLA